MLRYYFVELPQLSMNIIARLAIFEWAMQAEGCEGRVEFFAALHEANCQSKLQMEGGVKKALSFASVNFQLRLEYHGVFPTKAINEWLYTGWSKRWFYRVVGFGFPLRSTNREIRYIQILVVEMPEARTTLRVELLQQVAR